MLHRAASNAYSWWWASHIRTKQSKWLEQNLQDVEEKVTYMLKLIEEDGDSFAKRAEMYYRKRPELINFVEESYRAYRALAERYDHISGELQNANNTLATVFPEQVQFSMDEEEDNYSARLPSHSMHSSKFPKELPQVPKSDPPKFPGTPKKGKEGSPRKFLRKTQSKKTRSIKATNPQMTEAEALDEIDKLQKGILGMQTEKEFVKSSYESRISKYWEIEKEIAEMQERVWSLQEEFCVGRVIEDNDARNLMASTALRSCEETLSQLQEKQGRSIEEAKLERRRLKDSHEKLEALKDELLHNQTEENAHKKEITDAEHPSLEFLDEEVIRLQQVRLESESIREKIREHFEMNCNRSFTVTEVAEKIEELVTKVIILENAVLSQTALLQRLRSQTNEIQEHLRSLEEDKTTVSSEKLKQLEEELQAVQDLNRNIENQNNNLETHFTEAHCNLDHLSEKLKSAKETDEVIEVTRSKLQEDASRLHVQPYKEYEEVQADVQNPFDKSDTETRFTSKAEENEEEAISPLTDQDDLFDLRPMSSDNLQDLATEIVKQQEDGVMKEDESSQANDNGHQDQVKKEEEFSLAKGNEAQDQAKEEQESSLAKENKQQDQVKEEQGSSQAMDNEQKGRVKEEQDSSLAKDNEQKGPVKEEQESSQATDSEEEEDSGQETEPNWRELFLNSLDGREKILLQEYTSILRNYKEVKKKLTEAEKKNRDGLINTMVQLKELKRSNAVKDEEIRSLRKNLMFLQATYSGSSLRPETGDSQVGRLDDKTAQSSSCQPEVTERMDESTTGEVASTPLKEDLKVIPEPRVVSPIEEKFRTDIDDLLEENLEFWLRFSTAFHHIEKFQTEVHDLKAEYFKLKDNKKQEGSITSKHHSQKSDARAIYKHLREIQTELQVWLEQNMLLKDELKDRISSLCDMQEEIKKVLECGTGTDEEAEFTSYQAAKFQGEILNMKQENNKVADQLQAGLDHVNELQLEIESTLARLDDKWKLSGSKNHHNVIQSLSRTRIPLRSLLFGVKAKKKPSLFSCISPALQKQYSDLHNHAPI